LPGRYVFKTSYNETEDGYVSAAKWGNVDLLREDLVIDSSSPPTPIEITVRSDGATLKGTINDGEEPAKRGELLLATEGKRPFTLPIASGGITRSGEYLVARSPSSSTGEFQLKQLRPGPYSVVALDSADDLEYSNPQVMEELLRHATRVELRPNEESTISLQLLKRGGQ